MTYIKRNGYHTQRAKPWHILIDGLSASTLCGSYKHADKPGAADWWQRHYVKVDEIPEGHIICSVCERVQNKIPPFPKTTTKRTTPAPKPIICNVVSFDEMLQSHIDAGQDVDTPVVLEYIDGTTDTFPTMREMMAQAKANEAEVDRMMAEMARRIGDDFFQLLTREEGRDD